MIYKIAVILLNVSYKISWKAYWHVGNFVYDHLCKDKYLTKEQIINLITHRLQGGKL